jgi:hypothetical protein
MYVAADIAKNWPIFLVVSTVTSSNGDTPDGILNLL